MFNEVLSPKNFSVLTQNATSVTFGWILNGKEYISKYRIECCQIRCAKIIFIDNISSTKAYATVHPLLPFTMYECKMKTFFSFASDMAVLLNSVVAVKTDTTVPSQPRELKAIIMSPSHVKLISKNSLHINGILKQYLVTLKGLKTYNSSFLHQKTIAINCTHFDIQNVYPGTTYFFNVKTENNAFVGPASNITTTVTPYDKPNAPPITVEKLGMQETVLTLNSASDETGPIRFYQLTIKKYWKLDCSYGLNNTTLMIETASTHVPLNVDIYKGVEDVTIAGTIRKFSLTETYLFCWRAVLNETTSTKLLVRL
ncbi:cytokine receptor-like isoform X2 [Hydractinia symbiolongicarpus]|uniref:cytokine receptor-like isoform X2 n=1 Tax=Hydractinia symbiolongicarpus TaxID=13093 RepID=UPI002550FB86|nr:cytokine receptor-like isoform X2 [Hydractinia symbiolongicarpus]XP_057298943.1 cytokine receptor-like isoform X2 [Hydractinia symbiolongicarpus]